MTLCIVPPPRRSVLVVAGFAAALGLAAVIWLNRDPVPASPAAASELLLQDATRIEGSQPALRAIIHIGVLGATVRNAGNAQWSHCSGQVRTAGGADAAAVCFNQPLGTVSPGTTRVIRWSEFMNASGMGFDPKTWHLDSMSLECETASGPASFHGVRAAKST